MECPKINLNINKDDSNLNDYLISWGLFESRPNKVSIHGHYDCGLNDILGDWVFINNFTEIIHYDSDNITNDKILRKISETIYLSYIIADRTSELALISDIVLYYKSIEDIPLVEDLVNKFTEYQLSEIETEESRLNLVSISTSGLQIEHIDYKINDNIEDYYSKETWKSLGKLIKKIKKKKNGLSILYGDRGIGKTNSIKYISSKINDVVLFIPNNLIDVTINSPEFSNFLRQFENPTIVLDDCEMIFNEFFTKSNLISNNLIQLVDGLLTEKVKVNIITIFNVDDKDEIDHNLLDCNNLMDVVEFTELNADESNQLSESLGYKTKYKSNNRLIDVINNNKTSEKRRLGF